MNNEQPLISVIIPIYNVEKYLAECLESILAQTYQNLEIICVNDGTPDNSEMIIDKFIQKDDRIVKINKENQGLNMARATGFEVSKGEFIMFVDSDDAITPTCVADLYERLQDQKTDIAVGGYEKFTNLSEINYSEINQHFTEETTENEDVALGWLFLGQLKGRIANGDNVLRMTAWAKLYKREIIEKTDWQFSNYRINEDEFEMVQWFSMARDGVAVTTKPVYYYRVNPESITQSVYSNVNPEGNEINRFEFAYDLRCKTLEYLAGINKPYFQDLIERRYIWTIQNGAVRAIEEGSLAKEAKYVIENVQKSEKQKQLDYEAKVEELANLKDSSSWRITAPLRKLSSVKLLRPLLIFIARILRLVLRPQSTARKLLDWHKYRNAWVVSDRFDQASDNGILFYDYLVEHHPKLNVFFVISADFPDFDKLRARGVKVIDHGSDSHKKLMKYAVAEASAFFNFAPFDMWSLGRKKPLKRAFIRHGIEQSDLSWHYERLAVDMYCDVLEISRQFYKKAKSIVDISHENIQTTGMPRYDLLRQKLSDDSRRSKIVLAPTWRRLLSLEPGTNRRRPYNYLFESEYYKMYNGLLQSKELKKLSRKYEIVLIPHPEILSRIDDFEVPEYITINTYKELGTDGLYDLALETELFISDFSSTTFDFAFLGAKIAYFNFDESEFYSHAQGIYKSWFDISRDGFGPNFQSLDALKKYLASEKWQRFDDKIDKIWQQIPENASENIYREIKKMIEENDEK